MKSGVQTTLRRPGRLLRDATVAGRGPTAVGDRLLSTGVAVLIAGGRCVVAGRAADGLAGPSAFIGGRNKAGLQGNSVDVFLIDFHGRGVRVTWDGRGGGGGARGADGGGGEGSVPAAFLLHGPLHAVAASQFLSVQVRTTG